MPATTDQTSITVAQPAVPRFAQDPETRFWVMSGREQSPGPSRSEILRYTQLEIAKLRRLPHGWDGSGGAPLHPALANVAFSLVAAVTTGDRLATPQFSPSQDGGLSIVWLVDGDRLTASLELDEFTLCGRWSDGQDAFRFEYRWVDIPREQFAVAVEDSRAFLEKISTNVQHQLLVL